MKMKQVGKKKESSEASVSCVIPTYNRCPSIDNIKYNPPWWAAVSLSNQKNVGEIIFVDDASKDFTKETIEEIGRRINVDVKYARNDRRKGSGKSRNLGVEIAKNDYIFFMDDDCVMINGKILPKLKYAFEYLEQEGIRVGAMTLPVSGDSLESSLVPSSEIGRVDRNRGVMFGCYSKFPKEYFKKLEDFYIDENREILKPLKIELMGGVFLSSKEAFEKTGGFPITPWRNACAEEPQLALTMQKNGYGVFYLPSLDQQFRVFHCRYGDSRFNRIPYDMNVDGVSFNRILSESSSKREDTGNRVSRYEEAYSNIISDMFVMFNFYGEEIGLINLKSKHDLLIRKKIFSDVDGSLEIFKRAVNDGANLLLKKGKLDELTMDFISSQYIRI